MSLSDNVFARLEDVPYVEVNGTTIKYRNNPFTGGIVLEFYADSVQIPLKIDEVNEVAIRAAYLGYLAGQDYGKHLGRESLKNDFKRLMDLFR